VPAAGFTLIEIIVVMTILAVAGILIIPAVQPALEATRAEAGARKVATFLDDARRHSVFKRRIVTVRCRPDENQLQREVQGVEPKQNGNSSTFAVPEPLTLAKCQPEAMRYFPQGGAEAMELTLRDPRGRERVIKVGTFTGLARIEDRR
jgi:prepilin-type N-terminal cleavage/methylation domain-containing protein